MSELKELYPVKSKISHEDRERAFGQTSQLIWFTGLSGSGKSTLAVQLESLLFEKGYKTYLLDGDTIRTGLNSDLGFSEEDRIENIRRIAEVSKLMIDSGIIVLGAFISPLKVNREMVKKIVGEENYFEVFVDTPLEVCEQRDVKGLYKKARAGELKNFTGISSPYEKPERPSVVVKTDRVSAEEATSLLLEKVEERIKL
ncbi:MAG: adenylyl-sulfate kinase [Cyclobacteriaceae bacterium]